MKKVKKVRAVSVGKVLGIMYGIMGLVIGGFITIFAVIGKTVSGSEGNLGAMFLGIGAIIILPLVYGVLGFIFGVISGWIYNIAAKWVGGLEVEIEE